MSSLSSSKRVAVYVDGTCSYNQLVESRVGGWGCILMLIDDNGVRDERPAAYKELNGTLLGATNNQAELEAVKQALLSLKQDGITLTIYSDSEYVIGVLSQHWKPARNKDLIAEIKTLLNKHTVTFAKVKADDTVTFNERANELARTTAQS